MEGTTTAAVEPGLHIPEIVASLEQPCAFSNGCPGDYGHIRDATFALAAQPSSVKIARTLTAKVLDRWDLDELHDDVVMVVSELVTNALRYGAPLSSGQDWVILVRLVRELDSVMCLVADPSDQPPVLKRVDYTSEAGRGLGVVDAYSHRWGWAPCCFSGKGKIVWAVFQR